MELTPYLTFAGNCREAFNFYEQCLGGSIAVMMTHGEVPPEMGSPAGWEHMIMHAKLDVGAATIMGSDRPPDSIESAQGMAVSLNIADPAEADRIFEQLATDGTVQMPIGETFWAIRFGMVTDRFGIPWMVNCEAVAAE